MRIYSLLITVYIIMFFCVCLHCEQVSTTESEKVKCISKAEIENYINQVQPLVQEVNGCNFKSVPIINFVDRLEIVSVLEEELKIQLKVLNPEISSEQLKSKAHSIANSKSTNLLSKYGLLTKKLYIIPGNIDFFMKVIKGDEIKKTLYLKMLLAHELTHALQGQNIDINNLILKANTTEKLMAYNAVIEGHAVLVQEKVGKLLGVVGNPKDISRDIVIGTDFLSMQMAAKVSQQLDIDTYLGGRNFMEWHEKKHGFKALWQILANPPIKTSMIIHPEQYKPESTSKVDYAPALEGIDKCFESRQWESVSNTELGEFNLRAAYSNMSENNRNSIIKNIENAQCLTFSNDKEYGVVTYMKIKNNKTAKTIVKLIEEQMIQNITLFKAKKIISDDVITDDIKGIKTDYAHKVIYAVPNGNKIEKYTVVRILNKSDFIEILTCDISISDDVIKQMSDKIFDQINEMKSYR